ncbi:MAG: host attachment protein [Alphaproteobacteria bacterium]
MPVIRKNVLVLVFDAARARFFEHTGNGRLNEVLKKYSSLAHHSRDVLSDKPGRGFRRAGSSQRHAYEPQHDEHKMEKRNFTQQLVQAAEHAYDLHTYDELVVVAPKRSLGEFRALAPAKLKRVIAKEVAKDLAGLSQRELERHLQAVLR